MSWLSPQSDKSVAVNADAFNVGFQQGATGAREAAAAEAEVYKQKIAKEAAIAVNDADNIRLLREKQMQLEATALKESHDQMERTVDTSISKAAKILEDPLKWDIKVVEEARDTYNLGMAEKSRLAEMRRTSTAWNANDQTSGAYFTKEVNPSLGSQQKFNAEVNKEVLDAEMKGRVLRDGTYPGGPNDGKGGGKSTPGATGTDGKPVVDLRTDATAVRQFSESLSTVSGNLATYSNWSKALADSQKQLETLHAQKGYGKRTVNNKTGEVISESPIDPADKEYADTLAARNRAAVAVNKFKTDFNPTYSSAITGIQQGMLDSQVPEASKVMTEVLAKVPGNVYDVGNYQNVVTNLQTLRQQYEQIAVNSVPSSTERQRLNAILAILQRLGADTMGGGQ